VIRRRHRVLSKFAAVIGFALMALAMKAQVKTPAAPVDHAKKIPGVTVPGNIDGSISEWDLPSAHANPQGLFFSASDGTVWCAEEATDKIERFDPKTQKFETFQLRPGSHPNALIAHSGSGVQSTVYFTSLDGGFIGEFDPNTHDVREFRLHGGASRLNHLVFDPNGMMWFTMASAHPPQFPQGAKVGSVSQFSTESRLTKALGPGTNPYDIAVDSKGTIFFTELGKPVIGVVDPVTMDVKNTSLSGSGIGVEGITITRDDVIWYTDAARGYLGRFDPHSSDRKEWPSPSDAHSHPAQITHAGNAIFYVETGTEPNMLVRFDPQTEKSQSWALPGTDIGYIYAEANGTVWFSRPEANRIGRMQVKSGRANAEHN
jgi:virginiamycin B lyase